ncbi:MAG: NADPH dehydrogenase [Clostridiales Family XIII bacterium]|jgi:NADPH2 dehydrogenase|nr:NADPH dehydrogenase [Clostridiales Family XIII bacterium]
MSKLYTPYTVKDLTLPNRIIMPPMCMYQAVDGKVQSWHKVHYASRAVGGVGLIIVEATGVCPEGRITDDCLGLWNDELLEYHKELVTLVHELGGKIAIQLNHAGRKSTVSDITPEAPSAIAYDDESLTPTEMTVKEIEETVWEFKWAADRAKKAGYDAVEIHAAHGYLLSEFLSPCTNTRTDQYGGSIENRVRFAGEVLAAVSEVWPDEKPIFIRISAEDYEANGNHAADLAEAINLIKDIGNGIDVVDVSTGGVTPTAPKAYPGYQLSHAQVIRQETGLDVIGGGLILSAQAANGALIGEFVDADGDTTDDREIDLVYLGRELLRNPYLPLLGAKELGDDVAWPSSYERAKPR